MQGIIKRGKICKRALAEGKLMHAHVTDSGFNPNSSLGHEHVIMYAKCGPSEHTGVVFERMPERNTVSWNVMIATYARSGYHQDALALFSQMQRMAIRPDEFTFSSALPACAKSAALEDGKKIHKDLIKRGFLSNVVVRNALADMYAKCGVMEHARQVFDERPERSVVSWTAMIAGYAQVGDFDETLKLFEKMPQRDVVSWNAMVVGYAQIGDSDEVQRFFQQMPERNAASWNAMIVGYLQKGRVDEALKLFQKMPEGDMVAWTVMITGYAQKGYVEEALKLFLIMPWRDVVAWNAMMGAYAQNGYLDEALKLFQKMPAQDIVSWTTVIGGCAENGRSDEALKLFGRMPLQNLVSWNALIAGCAQNGQVGEALELFRGMPERDVFSWTAMIAGQAKNGHVDGALNLFQKMPERNVVSWNAMIAGCEQHGHSKEALNLFQQMQLTGVKPVSETFGSVLLACAHVSALTQGRELHQNIIRSGFQFHIFVGSALVNMYARCGSIRDACLVFDTMPQRSVVAWSAMIVGYAMHGCGKEALQLFEQMQESGMKPDRVTFIGVLSACCHAGLVDDGWKCFDLMSLEYHLTPTVEHYGCMVDLLGRAGRFHEAQVLINKMPIKPSAAIWGSLLGACRIHCNIGLGESVAEQLFELEPKNAGNYVLLSNIYAAAGRWYDFEKVQQMRKGIGMKKRPGCSWIEVNRNVHSFLAGDRSHPQTHKIYEELERLSVQMEEEGYVPNTNFVLHDVE